MRTTLLTLAAMLLCLVTSCSDDDTPKVPENASLYQQYEVDFNSTGASAFANFRLETANGRLVKLPNGTSITANGIEMSYMNHEEFNAENPGYNVEYDYTFMSDVKDVVRFELKRGNRAISNLVRRDMVSNIDIPHSFSSIVNGTEIKLDNAPAPGETFVARLESVTGTNYTAQYNAANNSILFVNVPAGSYNLAFLTKRVLPLQESDNNAGGSITIYYIDRRTVNVTNS